MSGSDSIDFGTGARFGFNYNVSISTSASTSSSNKSDRALFFNGDSTLFSFWKTNMYSHIVEEGVQFENMDGDGIVSIANRKLFT
ncbi:hypothetical protein A2U01_0064274, partial [Trifolium medium]|nr:hypothetical protein [Trifolium medium]